MKGILKIIFEDGTSKTIDLGEKVIEINLPPEQKQSISIHQRPSGDWAMSFTKPIMDGKRFQSLEVFKIP